MGSLAANVGLLALAGGLAFVLSLVVRRRTRAVEIDATPWGHTLSYVATAYGVVVGFSIIFLFGEFADARQAVGDEATSIGTAYEEAALFPEAGPGIQRALLCYSRAVPTYDWPAMEQKGPAPEVDAAFADVVASLGQGDQPTSGALESAAATNLVVQVGSISTARETRLVAAETQVPPLLWFLLVGGGLLVVAMIFVVTLSSGPRTQGVLVGLCAVFTTVMVLIVLGLSRPYGDDAGQVTPQLIEETTATMEASASPDVAAPCDVRSGG